MSVPRFIRLLTCLFCLTGWLAASEHCELEALGFLHFGHDTTAGCEHDENHATDGCDLVENGNYPGPNAALKAPTPAWAPVFCLTCAHELFVYAPIPEAVSPHFAALPLDPEWQPTWQFTQRAAPPSRAPTLG